MRRFRLVLWVLLGLVASTVAALVIMLAAFSRDLPAIEQLSDYQPPQATKVYADDGALIGIFAHERRTVVPFAEIPQAVVRAFLAAEDAGFYAHEGLDYLGILRATIKNLRPGAHLQGASTITQQTVKTLITGAERSYGRKMREALLARRLEQLLSKDEILHLYLNQIYFGSGAYGVEEAAQVYFGKSVRELTLAEAAAIAGIPKNPSRYHPRATGVDARTRRDHVLRRMREEGWGTEEAIRVAIEEPLSAAVPSAVFGATPHFVEQVRRELVAALGEGEVYRGGLTVYATMRTDLQLQAQHALRQGLEDLARRQGYPGPALRVEVDRIEAFLRALRALPPSVEEGATPHKVRDLRDAGAPDLRSAAVFIAKARWVELSEGVRVVGIVDAVEAAAGAAYVDIGPVRAQLRGEDLTWARAFAPTEVTNPPASIADVVAVGDLVEVALHGAPYRRGEAWEVKAELIPRVLVEGALVAVEPFTRHVVALVGGYAQNPEGLLRVTQSRRQPGSAFKPILYATAVAKGVLTAATLCADSPVVMHDPWTGAAWKPENYSGGFEGNILYRTALVRSKNTCSVKLIQTLGPPVVIAQARAMGIQGPLPENLTLALGTGEVTPLELANAYATFATLGLHAAPIVVRKVVRPTGEVVFEKRATLERVLDEAAAYVTVSMLQAVVEEGTGAQARALGRAVAGKTGTTQNHRDAWFAGFAPGLVAAVWLGFDDNAPLGRETGSSAALPVWVRWMAVALADKAAQDFRRPEGVTSVRVDPKTGLPSDAPEALEMDFVVGTEPVAAALPLESPFLIDDEPVLP